MIVCPLCGNKRCPHAESHRLQCTGSNAKDQVATLLPKGQLAIRPDLAPVRALTEQDLSLLLSGLESVIEVAKVPMDMVREIVGPNPSGIAAELLANMSRGIGGFEHCRAMLADRWRHKNAADKEKA